MALKWGFIEGEENVYISILETLKLVKRKRIETAFEAAPQHFDAAMLLDMKFPLIQVVEMKFSSIEIKEGGYSTKDCKAAGYSAKDCKAAGYSAKDCNDAGYSAKDCKAAGYSAKEILALLSAIRAKLSTEEKKRVDEQLYEAARSGKAKEVERLIDAGANPNYVSNNDLYLNLVLFLCVLIALTAIQKSVCLLLTFSFPCMFSYWCFYSLSCSHSRALSPTHSWHPSTPT